MKQILGMLVMSMFVCAVSCRSQETKRVNVNSSGSEDISDPTNKLTDKKESLELQYLVWGCACPNWITPLDYLEHESDGMIKQCIFIEPADEAPELPLYFDPTRHRIKVNGQFYVKEDYPKGTVQSEENLPKAKVFRYTDLKVIDSRVFLPKDDIVLQLSYNAISCTCAQWSESGQNKSSDNIYLEPADKSLLNADDLFTGENLPLKLEVIGQFVSEVGYPVGFNAVKGNPEPARVFRYSKVKVVRN